jgi:hypothetical protein
MDPKTIALVGIRAAALAMALTGQSKAANALYTLADAYEAGKNIDAHMAEVARRLKDRSPTETDSDWDDLAARINADSARLQGS